MNSRERFLSTMAFEPADRIPLWEWDYWAETLRLWRRQGAPLKAADAVEAEGAFTYPWSWSLLDELPLLADSDPGFVLDPPILRIPLNSFICPLFEYKVIEEHEDTVVAQDPRGHIRRDKKGRASISNIVKPLVSSREDWERVKAERLALDVQGRLPPDWPMIREQLKKRKAPLAIGGHSAMFGFFHTARYLMGVEALCVGFYDQPDLVRDIMIHLADLYVFLFDHVLSQIPADLAFATEDMGFKTGPFISPQTFREFMLPCYQRVANLLRDHGVDILFVDSDGNNWPLIPLFLEAGVTGFAPLEVAADMDVVRLRRDFPGLQLLGGIDKQLVAAGPAAIDRELMSKVPAVLETGGYIPTIDHSVPPDVSWENFVYYRRRLADIAGGE